MPSRWLIFSLAAQLFGCASTTAPHTAPIEDGGLLITPPDAASYACTDAGTADAAVPLTTPCTPSRKRDFATEVQPLFASCSGELCHSFTAQLLATEVGLPAAECCGRRPFIAAGAPERSYLLDKLRGQSLCAGARMPLDQPPLSDAQIQTISDWICEGARTAP